jgi:hypothetical protein
MSMRMRSEVVIADGPRSDQITAKVRGLLERERVGIRSRSKTRDKDLQAGQVRLVWRLITPDGDPQRLHLLILDEIRNLGYKVVSSDYGAEPWIQPAVNAAGVKFDPAHGTLTVETWGPDWSDLVVDIVSVENKEVDAAGSSFLNGSLVEDPLPGLRKIVIRRPAGSPTSD